MFKYVRRNIKREIVRLSRTIGLKTSGMMVDKDVLECLDCRLFHQSRLTGGKVIIFISLKRLHNTKMTAKNRRHILWFEELGIKDVPLVGWKNASLGEMYRKLKKKGVAIPNGFAITAEAYKYLIASSGIE